MRLIFIVLLFLLSWHTKAQYEPVNHWETIIYSDDIWRYFEGNQQPDINWKETNFVDAAWKTGKGGFGFEDGDDSTLIPYDTSVYMRKEFFISDTTAIRVMILSGDFDDGFVAYLNGFEVARENIGTPWVEPPFNQQADAPFEAMLYRGKKPIKYTIRRNQLNYAIRPGKNVLAIQVHQHYFGGLDLSSNFFLHAGISDSTKYFRENPVWFEAPLYYEDSTHLPVFNFTSGALNSDFKVPGTLNVHYNRNGKPNAYHGTGNEFSGKVLIKYRGNSTLAFPKKSFRFELLDMNDIRYNTDLLEFPYENDWILYAPYSDKSLLRNYLTYSLARKTMTYAPRTKFAEVMHNGYYLGTYVFSEKIKQDENRVNIESLNPNDTSGIDLTGGYIISVDWDNTPTNSFTAKHDTIFPGYSNQTYQYYYPDPDVIQPQQKKYIQDYILNFENVLLSPNFTHPVEGYHNFIDKESFVDFFFYTELAKDIDGFRFSVYMHKENARQGGKLKMGPVWDFNLGFGNVDYGTNGSMFTYGWVFDSGGNRLFWYQKLLEDVAFANYMSCRWKELRKGALHTDSVLQVIDDGLLELGNSAAKNHNFWNTIGRYVWPNYFVGETYEEEIDYLKDWTSARLHWMDINMPGECFNLVSVKEILPNNNEEITINVYPNPFVEDLFIENTHLNNELPEEVTIYNSTGKLVYHNSFSNSNQNLIHLNLNFLPQGIYNIQLKTSQGNIINKPIIKAN